ATNELGAVRLEFFGDDINRTDEHITSVLMKATDAEVTASIPGWADRTVVRYRVWAERRPQGEAVYEERVYPRWDDPFAWQSYYVTPMRAGTNVSYDLLIS